jgi:hypothetical protein
VLITFWFKTLTAINDVSRLLQSTSIALDDLDRIRSSWEQILHESKEVAANLGFETEFAKKRGRKRKTFHDEAADTEHHHEDSAKEFQVCVFNVGLDTLIQQIKRRFQAVEKVSGIFSILWSPPSLSEDDSAPCTLDNRVLELIRLYPNDLSTEFLEEIRHFAAIRSTLFEQGSALHLLNSIYAKGLQFIFPQVCVALRIFISMGVSVAEGERSFSKLAIIKNCLRSTMGQERLSHLMVLSIESDLAKNVSYEEVVSTFAANRARKVCNLNRL